MNLTAKKVLKEYFGYDNFRPGQEEIINHILNKEDCVGIMPTGSGKSLCYQIPAIIFSGVTIVISPLISLMKDQVDTLNANGISATFINSSLSENDYIQTIENIYHGVYKIIYIAPERLFSETFIHVLKVLNVSMIAVDEAHCVSRWGHDFRPSYMEICNMVSIIRKRPIVVAFTATATSVVKEDIINLLQLKNPFTITTGFDRQNLYFSVQTPPDKAEFLLDFLKKHINMPGIIYCSTRKSVDGLFDLLKHFGYKVSKYHAGMPEKERNTSQNDFIYDRTDIMIATNAFGMGIDKSNVRYVVHYNMPSDLESYYQEAGRAGRDGDKAECVLLFNRADVVTNKFLIEKSVGEDEHNHNHNHHITEYQKLNEMVDYCNTSKCLRKYILEYFGEKPNFDKCDFCSNCNSLIETTDITVDTQKILSCIKRMNERFGAGIVCDVLRGANTLKIRNLGFNDISTYGIMNEYSSDTIRDLISFLVAEDYISSVGNRYPVLALGKKANSVLFDGEKVIIRKKIEKIEKIDKNRKCVNNSDVKNSDDFEFDAGLFDILRSLRKEIASDLNMPPFIIFTDVSLKEMCRFYPVNKDDMLKISGVGKYKLEKYGDLFIEAISKYVGDKA